MATDHGEEAIKRWDRLIGGLTKELQRSGLGIFLEKKNFGAECSAILLKFLQQDFGKRDVELCVADLLAVKQDAADPKSKIVGELVTKDEVVELVNRCNTLQ